MDDLRNPYSPGAGSRPPALVGREHELQLFRTAIGRLSIGRSAKSLLLTGLRGVGKTALLNEFAVTAHESHWQVFGKRAWRRSLALSTGSPNSNYPFL